jgi:tungstate transport system substrate-binding protein
MVPFFSHSQTLRATHVVCLIALAIILLIFGSSKAIAAGEEGVVILATTTSTENSGLLEYLLPEWQKDTGVEVKTIAVGTGKALQLGRAGDVDVVMVHAKVSELQFMEEGYGISRTEIMYNDFVLVGPKNDPLQLAEVGTAAEALSKISQNQSLFISRGDDSGTHKKELNLWELANVIPQGSWYREVGQGMSKSLQIAAELGGYTLTDRGTWLFVMNKIPMEIAFQGDPPLFNQYSIMAINPGLHQVNSEGAKKLIDWIAGGKGQRMINEYQINGEKLFTANAQPQ